MSREVKSRVLILARKSKISELDQLLSSVNVHWTECRYPSGDTPLHAAAQNGNIDVMRYLLESPCTDIKSVDVSNLAGKTALHEACQHSKPEAVMFLLGKGADPRALKQADWTPLMLACTKTGIKALDCCQLLLKNSGEVLLTDKNKDGWNALHIAAREGDSAIVNLLLLADPLSLQASMKSNNGRTPLHTAALHGCHSVVRQLLNIGSVDCNVKDSCGSTPLHDAVRSGSLDTFRALVQAGADVSVQNNEGYGLEHMAAQTGQIQMLQHLLESSVPARNKQLLNSKTTPLHCAVRAGQVESVQVLLQTGSDPRTLDSWGRSSYDIIPGNNGSQIRNLLKDYSVSFS